MRFPSSSLAKDEIVVFDVHHHPFVLARPAAPALAYLVVWSILVAKVGFFRVGWVFLAGLAILVLLLLYWAWRIVVWTHVNLVLTDRRLIYQCGVLTRHSRETPLSKINDVASYQMVLGRILGMGDLVIESASETGKVPFFDLPGPAALKLEIIEQMHSARGGGEDAKSIATEVAREVRREQPTAEMPPLPPERPPLYSEIVDQIERLEAMREHGAITDEEFEEAKRGLLDRLKRENTS
jgi:uncharacterized membrane protein YdbT with pleckstrin-like domain